MATHLIVLAAGQGTRMNSDRPKVLHELAGAPLFVHALRSAAGLSPDRRVVVAGHGAEAVRAAADAEDPGIEVALQEDRKGTAHAVSMAKDAMAGAEGDVFVLYGDTPFIGPQTLSRMAAARAGGADVVVLGFEAETPGRYGRLVVKGGALERIVEAKDATEAELAITMCNSGVVCADAALLFDLVADVGNENAAGEYYLTDIVALARARGLHTAAVATEEAETLGVNTRAELAAAEATFQTRARARAMADGVSLVAPSTVHFAYDTVIGRDAVVEPNVVFGPGVTVENGARVRAFSHLEGCHVSAGAVVGPYARLRTGAEVGPEARIGNFVEVKSAQIGQGAKVNHLSYIGDAGVGDWANVGAGTVTCNYDGVMKHRTEIGAKAFIGSSTMLVAPVSVGAEAMTASGSVITRDVPDGALGIARARQEVKPSFARRLMAKLAEIKSKRS